MELYIKVGRGQLCMDAAQGQQLHFHATIRAKVRDQCIKYNKRGGEPKCSKSEDHEQKRCADLGRLLAIEQKFIIKIDLGND